MTINSRRQLPASLVYLPQPVRGSGLDWAGGWGAFPAAARTWEPDREGNGMGGNNCGGRVRMEPWGLPPLHFECNHDDDDDDDGETRSTLSCTRRVCDHWPPAPGLELWLGLGWLDLDGCALPTTCLRYGSAFLGSESRIAVSGHDYASPADLNLHRYLLIITRH
jgi:hypothetical protein